MRQQQIRWRSAKVNTVVMFVPQQEAWIVERFGKFNRTLEPVKKIKIVPLFIRNVSEFFLLKGLNFLLPVIDSIKYVQSLKELAIEIPQQSAITVGKKSFFPETNT